MYNRRGQIHKRNCRETLIKGMFEINMIFCWNLIHELELYEYTFNKEFKNVTHLQEFHGEAEFPHIH